MKLAHFEGLVSKLIDESFEPILEQWDIEIDQKVFSAPSPLQLVL